jgi:hypothetical protein
MEMDKADKNSETATVREAKFRGVRELRKTILLLWTVQGLLAALFLFAGGMKLVLPAEALAQQSHMPGLFMKFIGAAEILGAIGLILPGLLGIRPGLTSLAGAGLVIIMIGATLLTLAGGNIAPAVMPLVVGLLSAFVAYGRWRLTPHRGSTHASALKPVG